jgi:5-methylcytosine-specific restriction endonuclease McrA
MRQGKCKHCRGENHNSLNCYQKRKHDHTQLKQRKPLRHESKAANDKRATLSHTFFAQNPPDVEGGYMCYLRISRLCPGWMPKHEVTLEHVLSKAKYPEVKYNVINIMTACEPCNKAKLSNTPYHLALIWPHIAEMIETPEWKAWEQKILPYLNRPLPDLRRGV